MPDRTMSWRRYFIAAAVICTFTAFCGIVALGVVIDRRFGSYGTIVPILAVVPGLALPALALALALLALALALARKPSRPPNYPRIEHLRISGKYSPGGAADLGVSPLHLQ